MERQHRPNSLERHAHKAAGMGRTIIMCCTPMELPIAATGVPVVVNLDAASPSTPGKSFNMVGPVLHLADDVPGEAEVDGFSTLTSLVGIAGDVRVVGWFAVEGTAVGDGRRWDRLGLGAVPSRGARAALVNDRERRDARAPHDGGGAVSESYTMILRPLIDTLGRSVDEGWS